MKKQFRNLLMLFLMACLVISCNSYPAGTATATTVQTPSATTSGTNSTAGLDLQALNDLINNYATSLGSNGQVNPSDIEREVNKEGGINNVSLDGDGQVNFVRVSEFNKNGKLGLEFYALTKSKGDVLVATTYINPSSQTVNVVGNPTYYGYNNEYSFILSSMLFYHYFSYPHSYYYSPYRYGHYYSGYHYYRSVPHSAYYSRPIIRNHVTVNHVTVNKTTVNRTTINRNNTRPNNNYRSNTNTRPSSSFRSSSSSRPSSSFRSSSSSSSRSSSSGRRR
jgi:hypothetical protein